MWSRWAWVINKKFWWIAREGHLPISKADLSWGTIIQVSWPPIETPSMEYPSKFTPFLCTSALALLYSSSSPIALPIADNIPEEEEPFAALKEVQQPLLPPWPLLFISNEKLWWIDFLWNGKFVLRNGRGKKERVGVKGGFWRLLWQLIVMWIVNSAEPLLTFILLHSLFILLVYF